VKGLLARVGAGQGSRLKRVVMLSSVGVNRRDDLMLKFRQMHVNLDARVGLTYLLCVWLEEPPPRLRCIMQLMTE